MMILLFHQIFLIKLFTRNIYIISNKKYKTNFFLSNKLLSTADFSFASGIFNVKFSEDESKWQNYVIKTIHCPEKAN